MEEEISNLRNTAASMSFDSSKYESDLKMVSLV
jgi:hypothetical protein